MCECASAHARVCVCECVRVCVSVCLSVRVRVLQKDKRHFPDFEVDASGCRVRETLIAG